ncbi:hypothetical protein DHEL01_v210240 [Diaporthe helianthi]|uniref:Uncharacterized protein n=1 Tax=Diaporthe helianthi TaxID=158607 RepID=A0A2P5HMB4_DIAHE|nr:hypothetical protein DHEL01_v210240 [Diaporthe helianthi]
MVTAGIALIGLQVSVCQSQSAASHPVLASAPAAIDATVQPIPVDTVIIALPSHLPSLIVAPTSHPPSLPGRIC